MCVQRCLCLVAATAASQLNFQELRSLDFLLFDHINQHQQELLKCYCYFFHQLLTSMILDSPANRVQPIFGSCGVENELTPKAQQGVNRPACPGFFTGAWCLAKHAPTTNLSLPPVCYCQHHNRKLILLGNLLWSACLLAFLSWFSSCS